MAVTLNDLVVLSGIWCLVSGYLVARILKTNLKIATDTRSKNSAEDGTLKKPLTSLVARTESTSFSIGATEKQLKLKNQYTVANH